MREADTERAILTMLHRHEVLTMDEILAVGYPACTWSDVFVALDRLSRQQLIVLHRGACAITSAYGTPSGPSIRRPSRKSRLGTGGNAPARCDRGLDACEVTTQVLILFLCCLVVASAILSFGLMLWFVVLGIVWFVMLGMEMG